MVLKKIIYPLLILSIIIACGSTKKSGVAKGTTLIDALTDFSIAINANDFTKVSEFLTESEKAQLVDTNGVMTEESKKKLKALRLQVLIKNPRIKLAENKLVGILSALPSLKHAGPKDEESEEEGSEESTEEDSVESGEENSEAASQETPQE